MEQKSNGTHLILMELMLVLCFFAICGSILVQVFVRSHKISVKAKEMTETTNYVTQAAELMEAGKYQIEEFKEYFPTIEEKDGYFQCYFDKNWKQTTENKMVYQMTIKLEQQKDQTNGKILMWKGKTQVYHLDVLRHTQGRKKK